MALCAREVFCFLVGLGNTSMDAILSYTCIRYQHRANNDLLFIYHQLQRINISWIGTCNHLDTIHHTQ